jgi:hypothetical protein
VKVDSTASSGPGREHHGHPGPTRSPGHFGPLWALMCLAPRAWAAGRAGTGRGTSPRAERGGSGKCRPPGCSRWAAAGSSGWPPCLWGRAVKRPAPDPGSGLKLQAPDSGVWRGPRLPVPGIGLPHAGLNGYLAGPPGEAPPSQHSTKPPPRRGLLAVWPMRLPGWPADPSPPGWATPAPVAAPPSPSSSDSSASARRAPPHGPLRGVRGLRGALVVAEHGSRRGDACGEFGGMRRSFIAKGSVPGQRPVRSSYLLAGRRCNPPQDRNHVKLWQGLPCVA